MKLSKFQIFLGSVITILSVLVILNFALGGATFSRVHTFVDGATLTASQLNAEFDGILNNFDPDGMDDASATAAAMRANTDPYPSDSESLATSLRGELQRIRYQLKGITNGTYWYDKSTVTIIQDADLDTYIDTEATSDVDGINIYSEGTQIGYLDKSPETTFLQVNSHEDADGDTRIQVEESNDEDKIRMDLAGVERLVVADTSLTYYGDEGDNTFLNLFADNGDDDTDKWRFESQDGGSFVIGYYGGSSWAQELLINTSGTLYSAGTATQVGGDPLCWDGSGGSYIGDCTSTLRRKENIQDYTLPNPSLKVRPLEEDEEGRIMALYPDSVKDYTSNIEMLENISVKTFNLKITPEQRNEDEIGLIAEQLYNINPLLVNIREDKETGKNTVTGIAWFNVVSWLVKVNQEQEAKWKSRVDDLEARIEALEVE